jgi:hypothetical protein
MENADKIKLVEEWKASGKSQAEFCTDKDINVSTFRSWLRLVATEKAEVEAEKAEIIKPKPELKKPFFVREKGVYIQNVNLGPRYRPCRLGEKIDITDDMDINVLKIMRDRGVIVLYGVN